MRQEPAIDRARLAAVLRAGWGVAAIEMSHIPSGEYAFCYRVKTSDGRFFAKIWPEPRPGYVSTESTLDMLRLTRALADRGVFTAQPAAVPTRSGGLHATLGGLILALFPFIDGARPSESEAFATAFGRTIAELQAATSAVADLPLRREALDIPFAEALPRAFDFLAGVGEDDRPGRRAARDLILPYRAEVMAELERLRMLQAAVRANDPPFVLCHRDIGLHNILAGDAGRLYFIDWDDVALAPPEHDLFFGRGPHFRTMLEAYFDAGGTRALSRDRFAFVHLRRVLDDMSFRLHTIMLDETGETDAHEVFGIEEWVIPAWRDRKPDFAEMADALEAPGIAG